MDDSDDAGAFRVANCRQIDIHLLGVFDTVGSLGVPVAGLRGLTLRKYLFHDPRLSSIVRHAFHAVAIDERRKPFRPTLWETKPGTQQVVEQVWFCGVHSDVGGGYPERGLSDVTLHWMLTKAAAAGLQFDDRYLATILKPDPLAVLHDSKTGLYRLTGTYERPIGVDPSGCEAVGPRRSCVTSTRSRTTRPRTWWRTSHRARSASRRRNRRRYAARQFSRPLHFPFMSAVHT